MKAISYQNWNPYSWICNVGMCPPFPGLGGPPSWRWQFYHTCYTKFRLCQFTYHPPSSWLTRGCVGRSYGVPSQLELGVLNWYYLSRVGVSVCQISNDIIGQLTWHGWWIGSYILVVKAGWTFNTSSQSWAQSSGSLKDIFSLTSTLILVLSLPSTPLTECVQFCQDMPSQS